MGLPSVSYSTCAGLFAPKNVPREIVGKLNAAAVEALADQAVRSRLADLGVEVYPRERQTPEALNALRKADAERWWPIIKQLGIKPGPAFEDGAKIGKLDNVPASGSLRSRAVSLRTSWDEDRIVMLIGYITAEFWLCPRTLA